MRNDSQQYSNEAFWDPAPVVQLQSHCRAASGGGEDLHLLQSGAAAAEVAAIEQRCRGAPAELDRSKRDALDAETCHAEADGAYSESQSPKALKDHALLRVFSPPGRGGLPA